MRVFLLLLVFSAAARAEYTEMAVVKGATISGRITYLGRPPHPKTTIVAKDAKICGTTRQEDGWLIGPGGGIANVVVYLVDVKAGKPFTGNLHPVLDQAGCHYVPHVQVVPLHSTLQVKSSDPLLHNVHSFFNGASVINQSMPPHAPPVLRRLDKPGGMQLKCDVHPFMRGAIFVADNPYWALTGADGSFEITDVPAGTYTIATWHEEGGPLAEKLQVGPGQRVGWSGRVH